MFMEAAGASGRPQWPIRSTEYSYSLVVVQHPERCRMAGFGDKDRRALSPPPFVKLIIRDLYGREMPVDDIDIDRFVVTAELFSADEPAAEMNLLLQTSLSTPNSHTKTERGKHPPTIAVLSTSTSDPSTSSLPTKQITSAVTRNLLGSVVVSGFKLTDLEGELGIWFIFNDLSVRTEGKYRLKFSFANLNMGQNSTPVTAVTFSNDFTCWSARRFPGHTAACQEGEFADFDG
ncbi:hypothetical protein SAICODRAFT_69275 [Saitoella complicata NRRL Y-17804]|uniref:uncharacterized protein n=1 Tax=Saitoella complicata (strain BCRC 22490 / CBS 7301 / JCM 7358 / NBRC 10748 / NRRL Y-17804) TaxID=698492 RepID=UPI0008670986|nr:uncharacterized protein SAICODRAFT_69275 [Saitoella complicata NRRL Y-17804]ODQ55254.1 hypothetical protein SAICODRAFT_69275 [Saitoella complicata NRRL Y-17804]